MNNISTVVYIMLMILAALAGVILIIKTAAKNRKPTPLAGLAFVLAITGILFGQDRLISYGLMVLAIVIVLFDIKRINKLRKRK